MLLLKQIFARETKLVLRASNFQGATIRSIVLQFSSARRFKHHIESFSTLLDETRERQN